MPDTDSYQLQTSQPIEISGNEDQVISFQLAPVAQIDNGTITGVVLLPDGTGANGVVVQLVNSESRVLGHDITKPGGRFTFSRLPLGTYYLVAAGGGYHTSDRVLITVTRNATTNVSITIWPNPTASNSAVFGTVQNVASKAPLSNVLVELFRREGSTDTIVAVATTDGQGNYLFGDIPDGTYYVRASKPGLILMVSSDVEIRGRQFVPMDLLMSINPATSFGTVSGLVTDQASGIPIPDALVALYRITNNKENIVDITRSNYSGYYLFGNLGPGKYIVRAKVQVSL